MISSLHNEPETNRISQKVSAVDVQEMNAVLNVEQRDVVPSHAPLTRTGLPALSVAMPVLSLRFVTVVVIQARSLLCSVVFTNRPSHSSHKAHYYISILGLWNLGCVYKSVTVRVKTQDAFPSLSLPCLHDPPSAANFRVQVGAWPLAYSP